MPGFHSCLQIFWLNALAPYFVYVARCLREGNITSMFSNNLPRFRHRTWKQAEQNYSICFTVKVSNLVLQNKNKNQFIVVGCNTEPGIFTENWYLKPISLLSSSLINLPCPWNIHNGQQNSSNHSIKPGFFSFPHSVEEWKYFKRESWE